MAVHSRVISYVVVIVGICATLWCSAPSYANEFAGVLEGPGVLIRFEAGTRRWAEVVLEAFPEANSNTADVLGITSSRRVDIHLHASSRSFRAATRYIPPDTLGVAIPSMNLIAIDCARAQTRGPNSIIITLRHEMIHIGFGRVQDMAGRHVPLWFNEGVATYAAGRLHEGPPQALVTAANTNSLLPFEVLESSFPQTRPQLELAYQQSESAVRFLLHKHDSNAIRAIVAKMLDGWSFEEAFEQITGGDDFEAAWQEHVRRRYPFIMFLTNYVSLFTILAIGVILAYGLYRMRRRRIRRRWAEEELDDPSYYYYDNEGSDDGDDDWR